LTKVFVVLLVFFSIAFASITVSIVAQTANWRETAEKYEQHARVTDASLRAAHAVSAARLASKEDEIRALQDEVAELQAQSRAREDEVSRLRSEVAKAASDNSGTEALNRGLMSQLQVAEAARAEYRKQRDDLEARNIEVERRNIDLDDRVNELTARVDVLLEQRRQYEQQINILREESAKLSQEARRLSTGLAMEEPEGAAMSDVVALSPVATRAIRGQVFEVSGNLVTISVGSADGVQKDMVFVIHREGEYVGDLKIDMVDPNQSVGRIVRSTSTPASGDQVTDALGLSDSRG
jgi:TolA-binding protein